MEDYIDSDDRASSHQLSASNQSPPWLSLELLQSKSFSFIPALILEKAKGQLASELFSDISNISEVSWSKTDVQSVKKFAEAAVS